MHGETSKVVMKVCIFKKYLSDRVQQLKVLVSQTAE